MTCLRPESLTQDPLERLAEASKNLWWATDDIIEADDFDEISHHAATTPVHEAGHAVVGTLAGRAVQFIEVGSRFSPLIRNKSCLGYTGYGDIPPNASGKIDAFSLVFTLSPQVAFYNLVGLYAGGAAEIRADPRRVASALEADRENAGILSIALGSLLAESPEDLQTWAWSEACRMMADPQVWSAVTIIADRLKSSRALPPRTSGGFVRSTVRKHLPNGWAWSRDWQSFQRDSHPA